MASRTDLTEFNELIHQLEGSQSQDPLIKNSNVTLIT